MLKELIELAIRSKASDLHITEDRKPCLRVDGELVRLNQFGRVEKKIIDKFLFEAVKADRNIFNTPEGTKGYDTSFSIGEVRFRLHAYKTQGKISVSLRVIPVEVPDIEKLNLPEGVHEFYKMRQGLILVTGPTGSGKSTTLASILQKINKTKSEKIVTIEDPIEFIYSEELSEIHQREVGRDALNFSESIRQSLRQDPNILLVGEMRDLETIENTLILAETGHLVFSTVHTNNTPETFDRLINVFPGHKQEQIRIKTSAVIRGILAQRLIPKIGGGRVPLCELLIVTDPVRNMVRERKPHNAFLDAIRSNKSNGSITFVQSALQLYRNGLIDESIMEKYLTVAEYEEIKTKI